MGKKDVSAEGTQIVDLPDKGSETLTCWKTALH